MSDPVEVRHHVWESLVSMLRVYAHAASLHGSAYEVTAGSESAWVKHQDSALSLQFSADTGEGNWCVTHPEREECGAFRIEEDGKLTFPVGPKELDTAAIDWLDHLGRDKVIEDESTSALAPTINP
jgi:hypothetical protein